MYMYITECRASLLSRYLYYYITSTSNTLFGPDFDGPIFSLPRLDACVALTYLCRASLSVYSEEAMRKEMLDFYRRVGPTQSHDRDVYSCFAI